MHIIAEVGHVSDYGDLFLTEWYFVARVKSVDSGWLIMCQLEVGRADGFWAGSCPLTDVHLTILSWIYCRLFFFLGGGAQQYFLPVCICNMLGHWYARYMKEQVVIT